MDKKYIYIIGGIILLILILLLVFYEIGKSKGKAVGSITNVTPPANAAFEVSTPDGKISDTITQYATNLYNDMSGINWLGVHDTSLYQTVSQLKDGDLINVYNAFNNMYQKESGYSLVGWINSEYFSLFQNGSSYANTIVTRLAAFGAK